MSSTVKPSGIVKRTCTVCPSTKACSTSRGSMFVWSAYVPTLKAPSAPFIFAASQTDILTYWHYLLAIIPQNDEALANAREIAKDIDQRNGNSYYQTQLDWLFGETTIH